MISDQRWQDLDEEDGIGGLVESEMSHDSATQLTIGGPRYKSEGIDPAWFGLIKSTAVPKLKVKKEWLKDDWPDLRAKRPVLARRIHRKGGMGRAFVA